MPRLGFLPKSLSLDRPVWIHAVSVGEVMAVKPLLAGLRKLYPGKKFVISTVTATGNKVAKGLVKKGDLLTYLPLDFSFIVRPVISRIRPSMFILAETEVWPNLIRHLHKNNIPVITVNGRISDNSFKGYSAFKFLVTPVLRKISLFCAQTQRDAHRLLSLGVEKDKVKITGSMKFDSLDYLDLKKDNSAYKAKLGLVSGDKLLTAGSTHPGEEKIVLGVYKELLDKFFQLKLLIAPRHPERAEEVVEMVKDFGFSPVLVSKFNPAHKRCKPPVFVLDFVGELVNFYSVSDIVFVGGSLIRKGGQNILEPALFAKPILFGPHMFNFRDISADFLAGKAAVLVRNQGELRENIERLLKSPFQSGELGSRARELVFQNRGAAARTVEFIRNVNEKIESAG